MRRKYKRNSLVGQRFGKRIVLAFYSRNKHKHVRWKVRCDCGRVFTCLTQDLHRSGPCRECSPGLKADRPHKRKRPYEAQYNAWCARAKKRHPNEITYEQFLVFTAIAECHYCGAAVNWMRHGLKGTPRINASNLDRKDSGKPYTVDNVVVCCSRCNYGKNTFFTYDEWKQIGALIRSWGTSESVPDGTGNSHDLDGRSIEPSGDRDSPKDAVSRSAEPQFDSELFERTHTLVPAKSAPQDHPLPGRRSPLSTNWSR